MTKDEEGKGDLVNQAVEALIGMSMIIDRYNLQQGKSREAILWGRVAKVAEECGETIAALIGITNQNPRKGVTHNYADLVKELQDVAITALGAIEHIQAHRGRALEDLMERMLVVKKRIDDRAKLEELP